MSGPPPVSPRPLKVWSMILHASPAWFDAWPGEPVDRWKRQVYAMVATPTKTEAARLFGVSVHEFNQYASEPGGPQTQPALDRPGVVLAHPLDSWGEDKTRWVPLSLERTNPGV